MRLRFQKSFTDKFSRLSSHQKQLAKDALEVFVEDPLHESLKNHPLKSRWAGYRSVAADDDLRLHYRLIDEDTALFIAIGSHEELYRQ